MTFTVRTLNILEFNKIVEMLAECAQTEGAKARALSLMPSDDIEVVLQRQERTADAKRLINAKGYPSFTAAEDTVSAADRESGQGKEGG